MSHFQTSHRSPFCQFRFVSVLFQIYFLKSAVPLSSACFLLSGPHQFVEQESHTHTHTLSLSEERNSNQLQKDQIHKGIPPFSAATCQLQPVWLAEEFQMWAVDAANTKAPKPLAGWSLGIITGTSSLRKNLESVNATNLDSQLHTKHELLNFCHETWQHRCHAFNRAFEVQAHTLTHTHGLLMTTWNLSHACLKAVKPSTIFPHPALQ